MAKTHGRLFKTLKLVQPQRITSTFSLIQRTSHWNSGNLLSRL